MRHCSRHWAEQTNANASCSLCPRVSKIQSVCSVVRVAMTLWLGTSPNTVKKEQFPPAPKYHVSMCIRSGEWGVPIRTTGAQYLFYINKPTNKPEADYLRNLATKRPKQNFNPDMSNTVNFIPSKSHI